MRRRIPEKLVYKRIFVGDAQFTDDPNDDWFCISFNNVWIGDFCPNCIYINKLSGCIKTSNESNIFVRLLPGFLVHRCLQSYKFDKHIKIILERFVRETFKKYIRDDRNINSVNLDHVLITLTQQRV